MNVLVVAAHPDDELLGAGGTVAVHADKGDHVVLAIMCEGISMRYAPERHAIVCGQARKAGEILGAKHVHLGNLPDQKLDTLPLTEVIGHVETLVREHKPETVYTHFGGDVNRDHQVLAEAVMVACRPYAAPWVKQLLCFETPSSTEWACEPQRAVFRPNCFVDISATLDRKLAAFACYEAEVCPYPHPRSLRALEERARYWGSTMNLAAAEPFAIWRVLR